MNTTVLLISIVASVVLVVLALLFVAGSLFRRDLARVRAAKFGTPQLTRDPLTLKDLLVEFFARSKGSARIIRLLAARRKPVGYQPFIADFRFDEKWRRDSDELPGVAIPAVLGIMRVAGLVRITRHGLSITDVGREVHRRMPSTWFVHITRHCLSITEVGREVQRRIEREPPVLPKVRTIRSLSRDKRRTAATLSSADRTVLRELRQRARTLIHQ